MPQELERILPLRCSPDKYRQRELYRTTRISPSALHCICERFVGNSPISANR
jgi:hypothetical protein